MFKPDAVMQYVRDVRLSAAFYAGIMGRPASQLAPGFALFVVPGAPALGLWERDGVQPEALGAPGACELTMVVADGMADPLLMARGPYDLLIANILAGPLVELAPDFAAAVVPGGQLLLAGLLETQEPRVRSASRSSTK